MSTPTALTESFPIDCANENCGSVHTATFSHDGDYGQGRIYAATCPVDGLTDYYTDDAR